MGFVMLGISTLTTFGINAALFGMVAHGLITGMFFFIAGSVKHRYHTYDRAALGNAHLDAPTRLDPRVLRDGQPRAAGLAGFWGEFPAFLSAYSPLPKLSSPAAVRTLMVIAAIGTVFAAAYLLWVYQRTAFGTPPPDTADIRQRSWIRCSPMPAHSVSAAIDPEVAATDHAGHDELHDVTQVEWIAWTPMLILILVLGVFPNLLFRIFDPPVTDLVARLTEDWSPWSRASPRSGVEWGHARRSTGTRSPPSWCSSSGSTSSSPATCWSTSRASGRRRRSPDSCSSARRSRW